VTATVAVLEADVTTLAVDAIANAANTHLILGAGVAGAIRRAGGPAIERACAEHAPIGLGEAAETTAGDLPCRWVIHAATMGPGGGTSGPVIEAATAATLERAAALGCRSVGLVAFGTGVGGFPLDEAARRMCGAIARALGGERGSLERIVIALRGAEALAAFTAAAADAGLRLEP
jgi:O-acetyl-ADP-ribose deacetylase (regulator of RNase III)